MKNEIDSDSFRYRKTVSKGKTTCKKCGSFFCLNTGIATELPSYPVRTADKCSVIGNVHIADQTACVSYEWSERIQNTREDSSLLLGSYEKDQREMRIRWSGGFKSQKK